LALIIDHDDAIFLQDNAPIHTAHIVREWLEQHFITVMNWPPYSPDLNLIENLWAILKREIYKYYPELLVTPNTKQTKEELITTAQNIWEHLGDSTVNNLADIMPHRIKAIIRAEGWYIQY